MTTTWLDALDLTPRAATIRAGLEPESILYLEDAIECFASVSDRPVDELAERVLCGLGDLLDGLGAHRLLLLVCDVLNDDTPRKDTVHGSRAHRHH
jgi:hypothetical protein